MKIKQQLEQVIANLHEHADQLNQLASDLNATSVWHKAKDIEEIVIPRLSAIVGQTGAEPSLETKIAAATAHRGCCGTEHDPSQGKLHGYCVVCGVPWPCDTAKAYMAAPQMHSTSAEQNGAEPVAILHDDGCYTFCKPAPEKSHYAGWSLEVYAAPQVPDGMVLVPEVLLRQIAKWLAESADPYDKAAYAINGLIATPKP